MHVITGSLFLIIMRPTHLLHHRFNRFIRHEKEREREKMREFGKEEREMMERGFKKS